MRVRRILAMIGLVAAWTGAATAVAAPSPASGTHLTAHVAAYPTTVHISAPVKFYFGGTTLPAGDKVASYTVKFDDGTKRVTGKKLPSYLTHRFSKAGTFTVTVSMKDKRGQTSTAKEKMHVTSSDGNTGLIWSTGQRVSSKLNSDSPVSLSCTSTSFCMAVTLGGDAYRYNGNAWSGPTKLASQFYVVSCATSTFCVAEAATCSDGCSSSSGNRTFGQVFIYDGNAWSGPTLVDTANFGFTNISCVTSTFCVGVDQDGYTSTFDGSTWSAPQLLEQAQFLGLSCPTVSFCMAVNSSGDSFEYSSGTWTGPMRVGIQANTVACRVDTTCVAGTLGDVSTPLASFSNGVWTKSSFKDSASPMSCSHEMLCVDGNPGGGVATNRGAGWTGSFGLSRNGGPSNSSGTQDMVGASCVSDSFCVMIDNNGYFYKGLAAA